MGYIPHPFNDGDILHATEMNTIDGQVKFVSDAVDEMRVETFYPGKQLTLPVIGARKAMITSAGAFTGGYNAIANLTLKQGTYTVNGITLTVTGNHIVSTGTCASNGYINLRNGEFNASRSHWAGQQMDSLPSAGVSGRFALTEVSSSNTYSFFVQPNDGAYVATVSKNAKEQNFTFPDIPVCVLTYCTAGQTRPFDVYLGIFPFTDSATCKAHIRDTLEPIHACEVSPTTPATLGTYTWGSGTMYTAKHDKSKRHTKAKYQAVQSASDKSEEQINIFFPSSDGYWMIPLAHTQNDDINSDVWRLGVAREVDEDGNDVRTLTVGGAEWECAIHLPGRDDFSGGVAHGDEIMIEPPAIFIDGQKIQPDAITERAFEQIEVVQMSTYYDPADHATAIATNQKRYIITADGINIQQALTWSITTDVTYCYMAMMPPRKAITSVYAFKDFPWLRAIAGRIDHTGFGDACRIYGDDCTFEMVLNDYPILRSDGKLTFLIHDNGGTLYNKVYGVVCNSGAVTAGELWTSDVDYHINV